jgi:hypothetical protein
MAAFQGWAAGPNFSGAAQTMAQSVQVEEQRKARQAQQLQDIFKTLGDAKRRKEDQGIASNAAKTAQENKDTDRAVNLFTAQGTRISSLQGRAPKNSDFLNNPEEYQPAVDKHNAAVQRLIDQQDQFVASHPALKSLLGSSSGATNTSSAQNPQNARTVDSLLQNVAGSSAGGSGGGNSGVANSLSANLAGGSSSNDPTTEATGNILDRFGRSIGGAVADRTQNYNPNAGGAELADGQQEQRQAQGQGLTSGNGDVVTTPSGDSSNREAINVPFGDPRGFGLRPKAEAPVSLSGDAEAPYREDTPESNRQRVQNTVFDALQGIPDADLSAAVSSITDAIGRGVNRVAPEGFAARVAAFGESNLKGRERTQEVITLKELAKQSAKGAVAGIAGAMAVITGGAALSTIRPGQQQIVLSAEKGYARKLRQIRANARANKMATRKRQPGASTAPPKPRGATYSSYPGGGKFTPLP